jgi:hypothetical protein
MGRGAKPGERRGGRSKGTPNRRSVALREAMNKAVEDVEKSGELKPLDFLLALIRDEQADRRDRLEAAKHAANFVHPRLISQDIRAETKAAYWISEQPLSLAEWSAEFTGPVIEGRGVPVAETVGNIHKIEVEVRNKRISQLEEELAKARDELKLQTEAASAARRIPLLS